MNLTHTFSPTQNNGRITSSVDGVTGENVSYTYDSLNRLIAASTAAAAGVQWGYTYSYDGFGNLADKIATKGSAQTVCFNVNSTTNRVRINGDAGYDVNGNLKPLTASRVSA
jgi:YD repeat-containing protein